MSGEKDLILDGYRFLAANELVADPSGFLFNPGQVFVCEGVTKGFSDESIRSHLFAHLRREVAEFNIELMSTEEKSVVEDALLRMFGTTPYENQFKAILLKVLPEELAGSILSELDSDEPDQVFLRRELFRTLDSGKFEAVSPLIDRYLEEKQNSFFASNPWFDFIEDEKEIDDIENDATIDSFFSDGMTIMTTPERKGTIIYLESSVKRINEFYTLDRRF